MTARRDPQHEPSHPGREPGHPDLLVRLTRLNPTTVVLATVALFVAILFLPDPLAAALLVLLAAGLGWLLRRTWPVLPRPQRVLRLVVIGLLLAIALSRVLL